MGSYGIGITRTVTAIVEQNNDEDGIIWPESVAPFQVIITIVKHNDQDQVELANEIYEALQDKGIEVMLDNRNEDQVLNSRIGTLLVFLTGLQLVRMPKIR